YASPVNIDLPSFPTRRSSDLMFLIFSILNNNWLSKWGVALATWSLKLHLPVKWLIKETIYEQFCGGESIEDSSLTIRELNRFGIDRKSTRLNSSHVKISYAVF